MTHPTLGTTTTGAAVPIQIDRLVESRLLLTANSGAGKSWAIRRLLEQTHGRVQHLVLDPEDEFHTLRERFDYVLAARYGADCIADPRHAGLLARKLLELNASAVIGLHELKAHDRVRFVRGFLEALVDAPRSMWRPALVVIDEAHVFCPQHGQAESANAVIDLMTRGRKRGLCGVLATQRISKLHKDAAAEANNKLVGRCALDVDMKRAADELGFSGRDEQHALRTLPPGEFFAFGPALAEQVTRMRVGNVATTHPKVGARSAPVPAARETVQAVLAQLADLPKEAEQEARTVESLGRRVRELEAELRKARAGAPDPEAIERARAAGREDGRDEAARSRAATVRFLRDCATHAEVAAEAARRTVKALAETLDRVEVAVPMPPTAHFSTSNDVAKTAVPARPTPPRQVSRLRSETVSGGTARLAGPEQRILDAIAWLEQIGITEPEQTAVAFLAGYTYGGGAFNNPRGALRTKGLVEYRAGDRIALTDDGRAHARLPDAPLTSDELHRRVLDRLPGPEQRLLRPLLDVYPDALSNEDLAERAGYTAGAGAFNNPRGRLRSLGLVEYPQPGHVVARGILFVEGIIRNSTPRRCARIAGWLLGLVLFGLPRGRVDDAHALVRPAGERYQPVISSEVFLVRPDVTRILSEPYARVHRGGIGRCSPDGEEHRIAVRNHDRVKRLKRNGNVPRATYGLAWRQRKLGRAGGKVRVAECAVVGLRNDRYPRNDLHIDCGRFPRVIDVDNDRIVDVIQSPFLRYIDRVRLVDAHRVYDELGGLVGHERFAGDLVAFPREPIRFFGGACGLAVTEKCQNDHDKKRGKSQSLIPEFIRSPRAISFDIRSALSGLCFLFALGIWASAPLWFDRVGRWWLLVYPVSLALVVLGAHLMSDLRFLLGLRGFN